MPPAPLVFAKSAMMEWAGNKITDHNRSEISVSVERIEKTSRMANGTLRKYVVADKRTFSTSWSDLPHSAAWAVDGFWAGREMESFYNANAGSFLLKLTNGDGTVNSYTVMLTKFEKTINKRGAYDFWNVSAEMTEV